jgi:hypothetical protein
MILIARFLLHGGYLLDLPLQYQKPIMRQIDPLAHQQLLHLPLRALLLINVVFRGALLVDGSADRELAPRHGVDDAVLVDDLAEVHRDDGAAGVEGGRVVDELGEFA